MLTIYGIYRSRATRNIWLAMEAGVPFQVVPVIQVNKLADPHAADAPLHTRHADFLKINPNGHIPAIDDGGFRMHESLAINLYLARKYGGDLAPRTAEEQTATEMWTLWAANEFEPPALEILLEKMKNPEGQRDEAKIAKAKEALKVPIAVLEDALTGQWLVGDRFTVADINVAECVRYAQGEASLFENAPRLKAWLLACQSRPAFKEMMEKREQEAAYG